MTSRLPGAFLPKRLATNMRFERQEDEMILHQTIGSARAERSTGHMPRRMMRRLLTSFLTSALTFPSLAAWGVEC